MRVATQIELTSQERAELTAPARSKLTSVRLALRARIILLAAQGVQNTDIAAQVGVGRVQVSRWRGRYAQSRLAGIESDLPRGAPPVKVDVPRLSRSLKTSWACTFLNPNMRLCCVAIKKTKCRRWIVHNLACH